jgi:hypothetical protein
MPACGSRSGRRPHGARGDRQLSRTGNEAIKTAEAQTIFKAQGFDAIGGTPEDFAVVQAQELTKWKDAVAAAGLAK